MAEEERQDGSGLVCPYCGAGLEMSLGERPQVVSCPGCAGAFVLPAADGTTLPTAGAARPAEGEFYVVDDTAEEKPAAPKEGVDSLRIRQIAKLKRATIRSMSFALVGAGFCSVAAVALTIKAVSAARNGNGVSAGLYAVGVVLCIRVFARAYYRYEKLKREAQQTGLEEPETPPDFTKLGDGSQRWKDIE